VITAIIAIRLMRYEPSGFFMFILLQKQHFKGLFNCLKTPSISSSVCLFKLFKKNEHIGKTDLKHIVLRSDRLQFVELRLLSCELLLLLFDSVDQHNRNAIVLDAFNLALRIKRD